MPNREWEKTYIHGSTQSTFSSCWSCFCEFFCFFFHLLFCFLHLSFSHCNPYLEISIRDNFLISRIMLWNYNLFFVRIHLGKCSDLGQINRFAITKSYNFIKSKNQVERMICNFLLVDCTENIFLSIVSYLNDYNMIITTISEVSDTVLTIVQKVAKGRWCNCEIFPMTTWDETENHTISSYFRVKSTLIQKIYKQDNLTWKF